MHRFGSTKTRVAMTRLAAFLLLMACMPAKASLLSGDALDAAATGIAWFVVFVVPIAVIVLFWMVHVLPEKIAFDPRFAERLAEWLPGTHPVNEALASRPRPAELGAPRAG